MEVLHVFWVFGISSIITLPWRTASDSSVDGEPRKGQFFEHNCHRSGQIAHMFKIFFKGRICGVHISNPSANAIPWINESIGLCAFTQDGLLDFIVGGKSTFVKRHVRVLGLKEKMYKTKKKSRTTCIY